MHHPALVAEPKDSPVVEQRRDDQYGLPTAGDGGRERDGGVRRIPHLWEVQDSTDTVYREMLRRPGIDLEELKADLALIDASWEETRAVHPVSPQLGFQALLARKQAEISRQQQALEEARHKMDHLVDTYMTEYAAARGTGVERLQGPGAVRARLRELMAVTERELLSCTPGGPWAEAGTWAAGPVGPEDVSAGPVTVRTICPEICPEQIRGDGEGLRSLRTLVESGVEIRTVPRLSFRVHIADRRTALVQLRGDDPAGQALVVEEPAVVAILCSFFEAVWTAAVPLAVAAGTDDGVSPQERELLRLLGQGLTDGAAARKLGVSLRTERRMLTRLSEYLDAKSRFQLGLRAAERGLL
jgi:DNA-binding CsgD family transcriptional regulator